MHNIPKTWHATSPSVQMARVQTALAARRRAAIHRLGRAHTTSPLLATRRQEPS
ncbi:hypothetical protein ACGF3C_02385 [Micromonospora sp. NPDC047762]|uniref:hypothetical protein n=1 Tax=Micromonospora sp. NPDC047762 TaxID=3364255 RepID=UPI00371E9844